MKVDVFLALAAVGALGATVAASVGAPPGVFAGALVITFFGVAAAAASAALALRAPDDLEEPRKERGPSGVQPVPAESMSRGVFGEMWVVTLGALAVLGFVPLVSLARKPGRRQISGWADGVRLVDDQNRPIAHDRLVDGGIETVFPENGVNLPDAPAVLIRVPPDVRAAVGDAPEGYVAFSKICTHAGCPVALYRETAHELYCPCHQSRFDVLNGAKNLSGPATRPLPRLAIGIAPDGYLVARADFDAPVGPDDWDRTS
jgi:ubiquinol-cytochrome c reductase iron-sulfur subunit